MSSTFGHAALKPTLFFDVFKRLAININQSYTFLTLLASLELQTLVYRIYHLCITMMPFSDIK